MRNYRVIVDKDGQKSLHTSLKGYALLTSPFLNKDTAYTKEERLELELDGKLPSKIETLEQQTKRCYSQFKSFDTDLQKFVYLNNLHDKNEVLFYNLVSNNIKEMIPIIYTPVIGEAVEEFSNDFRRPKGLYINCEDIERIDEILESLPIDRVRVMVVTDGEGVLGIGDQGVGGIHISIGKSMLYSLCGINPSRVLPVVIDVGTNNAKLLNDPAYLGVSKERIDGDKYHYILKKFVTAARNKINNLVIHWEDFGRKNAVKVLHDYDNEVCSFNDDMQGTGVVCLSALLAAINATDIPIGEHKIVIFGAGTAGMGIANQLHQALVHYGMDSNDATKNFYLIDRNGLLFEDDQNISELQKLFATDVKEKDNFNSDYSLLSVIETVKPTILVGASAVAGAFTKDVVQQMSKYAKKPIIFPLSNPTSRCESTPWDIIHWSEGRALIATGSPFEPVEYDNNLYKIAQCNNAFAFPGIGLGAYLIGASKISDRMLMQASIALSELAPIKKDSKEALLPSLEDLHKVAVYVAIAVINEARSEGLDTLNKGIDAKNLVEQHSWSPKYLPVKSTKL